MRRMIKLSQIEWLNNARAKEERINKAYDDASVSASWNVDSYNINIVIDEDSFIFSGDVDIDYGEESPELATITITITGLPNLLSSGILVATNSLGGNGKVDVNVGENFIELQFDEGADRTVYFSGMISNKQFVL